MATNYYYNRLRELQENYPDLTFQNDGYEYLSKAIQDKHKDQIREITNILKDTVAGFSKFNNFKIRKNGDIHVRLQYNWSHGTGALSFIGVGYFNLEDWKDYSSK
jgi:hypothetical protein